MRRNLIILLLSKGDKDMMAKLWASEILSKETIEEAKRGIQQSSASVKRKVKKLLIDAGMEEITE